MIYIKTRMRKMPECCEQCGHYHLQTVATLPAYREYAGESEKFDVCGIAGRIMSKECVCNQKPYWCPLVEIKEEQAND